MRQLVLHELHLAGVVQRRVQPSFVASDQRVLVAAIGIEQLALVALVANVVADLDPVGLGHVELSVQQIERAGQAVLAVGRNPQAALALGA